MIYGTMGTISEGTMRSQDLLASFSAELEALTIMNVEAFAIDARHTLSNGALIGEARRVAAKIGEDWRKDDFTATEVVTSLMEALQIFAPPLAYFGTLEGDGADFGFWSVEK